MKQNIYFKMFLNLNNNFFSNALKFLTNKTVGLIEIINFITIFYRFLHEVSIKHLC